MTHPEISPSGSASFSYRSARSGSFTVGITTVLAIETVALHFGLVSRYPIAAWCLTASSIFAIAWVVRDYTALGRGEVQLDDERLRLQVGRRFDISIPVANLARVLQPTFRDLPTPGTNQGRDYLNLTKPASPNVLLMLRTPMRVRLGGGVHRTVGRFGLHLDEPARFVAELSARRAGVVHSTAT